MRWVIFAILVYVVCVLQTTLIGLVEVHRVRPDLLVLTAAYVGLVARRHDACLAAWCLGLAADLCGMSFRDRSGIGPHALAFGLAALITVRVRELVFRDHLLTYVACAAAWTLLAYAVEAVHLSWALRRWDLLGAWMTAGLWTAAYTALLAPYAHWALRRARPLLGLDAVRTYRVRT